MSPELVSVPNNETVFQLVAGCVFPNLCILSISQAREQLAGGKSYAYFLGFFETSLLHQVLERHADDDYDVLRGGE